MPSSKLSPVSGRDEGAFAPYLKAVRHHPFVIVAAVAMTVLTSVAWLVQRTPTYEATAQILVTPISGDPAASGLPLLTDSIDPTRTIQTATTILESPRAAVDAAAELGPGWSAGRLIGAVSVEPQGDSNIIAVTAEAANGEDAAAAANAYARAVLAVRSATLAEQVQVQLAALEAQRDALGDEDAATAAALAGDIAALRSIEDGRDPNFALLQPARAPSDPVGVAPWVVIALALMTGSAIGVGGALVLEQLDRRLRDEDDLLDVYPLPVLARVPALSRSRGEHLRGDPTPPEVAEAFRTLYAQLEAFGPRSRVVMFTSPSAGDGKTTSAIDFATALAAADLRVVLLDLDLRKPDVGNRLNVSSDVRAMLRRRLELEDLLVPAPSNPAMQVVSAPPSENVAGELAALTRRLPELLDQARDVADYIVIDTAPLGRVGDALRIAAVADDVLLVTRPGNTTRGELTIARDLLERLGVTPTGMVVVGASGAVNPYYGYGHHVRQPPPQLAPVEPRRAQRSVRGRRHSERDLT